MPACRPLRRPGERKVRARRQAHLPQEGPQRGQGAPVSRQEVAQAARQDGVQRQQSPAQHFLRLRPLLGEEVPEAADKVGKLMQLVFIFLLIGKQTEC